MLHILLNSKFYMKHFFCVSCKKYNSWASIMVEFPKLNIFWRYFSDKSEKKVFFIFQVYLSLSSDQEKCSVRTTFQLAVVFCVGRKNLQQKTRNLQQKTRNLQQKTRNLQQKTRNLQQVLWADIWSNMDKIRKPR